jgi:hypothetical protein
MGIVALFLSIGCTGTSVIVMPDLKSIEPPTTKGCGKVAVTEITKEGKSKIPSELTIAFAKYLEQSGLFEEVYCPIRSTDIFDMSIDSKFDVQLDSHTGSNFAKAFITGLSWFVLEPIFWYENSFEFSGHLNIIEDGKTVATFDAKTKADLYKKFLSLGNTDAFKKQLWPNGLNVTFSQLLRDIETYCKQKPVETKTMTKVE